MLRDAHELRTAHVSPLETRLHAVHAGRADAPRPHLNPELREQRYPDPCTPRHVGLEPRLSSLKGLSATLQSRRRSRAPPTRPPSRASPHLVRRDDSHHATGRALLLNMDVPRQTLETPADAPNEWRPTAGSPAPSPHRGIHHHGRKQVAVQQITESGDRDESGCGAWGAIWLRHGERSRPHCAAMPAGQPPHLASWSRRHQPPHP